LRKTTFCLNIKEEREKKKLYEYFKKKYPNDYDLIDINSLYDKNLNLNENKEIIKEEFSKLINEYNQEVVQELKRKEAEIMSIEEYEAKINTEIMKAEQQAELEFTKALENIENDDTTNIIEEVYYIPKQFTKMVAMGNSKGFILYGEAGLGKSYSVMRAFREVKKEFVYLSGHITSLELYQFLFRHRKENIVLDDVNVLGNEINLNMLKSCLNDNSRMVCYNTSSPRLKVPNKFIFEGSICLLLNEKPRENESLKAVESRVLNYELKLNYKTKLKIMYELAKKEYKDLTKEEKIKIVRWIRKNTNEATENFNLRVLFTLFEMYRFDKENWIKMAEKILVKNYELDLILQGLTSMEWIEKTGKSRASYFRYKKSIKVS